MRSDPIQFALSNETASREPRYVVKIEFDVASIHITSHDDIPSVPGDVLEGLLHKVSAISQKIVPDEGRSEIGSFTFSLIDKEEEFTDAIRTQYVDEAAGLRRRRVLLYIGYKTVSGVMDFSAFQLFQTQTVIGANYKDGRYTIRCADITREQRKEVFRPVTTTLISSCTATDTTITVNDTADFEMVAHGSSFSDAPGQTVGYFRLEDEIIRYTGKTLTSPGTFTGCTRGVLNTVARAHVVDAATAIDRRQKIEEYIYLELPGPKLALAVLTGELYGTANVLPEHWHLGIDPDLVRESDFTGIGLDLWDSTNDAAGAPLIFRFEGLKAQDGKAFLEKQVYLPLGCFSPVYSDGTLGLKRRVAVISDASPVVTLTENSIVSMVELEHDYRSLHNDFRIFWAWNAVEERFARVSEWIDLVSEAIHGRGDLYSLEFRGIHSQRATDSTIISKLDSIRDAYAEPPQRLSATVFGSLNPLEVSDIVRVRVSTEFLRDFVGAIGDYNRSFEVQQKTYDPTTGDVTLELFASTARAGSENFGGGVTPSLPDAFYNASGTALSSVISISSGVIDTGSHTLTGHANLNNTAAIYYYLGDLTVPDGCTLTLEHNVQLRVMGFLTVNGDIVGTGNGLVGIADAGTSPWDLQIAGAPGFVGHSRGWDGVKVEARLSPGHRVKTVPVILTRGQYDAFPILQLSVSGTSLQGLPNDLRGTGGPPGGRIIETDEFTDTIDIHAVGGQGGDGGAGLAIICRGMGLGASGSIILNGANTSSPGVATPLNGIAYHRGAGGAGGPGSLLILLDGDSLSVPDVSGKFFASSGTITQPTPYLASRETDTAVGSVSSGFADPAVISGLSLSTAAHRIQYIPSQQVPEDDPEFPPVAPTALAATIDSGGITWDVTIASLPADELVEVWTSIDNNRSNATLLGRGRGTSFHQNVGVLETRFAWTRIRRESIIRPDEFSDWFPSGATSGITATTLNPGGWTPVKTNGGGATMIVTTSTIEKSNGTTAWDSAVHSLEAYHNGSYLSARAAVLGLDVMLGLNTDPTTNASYTSIDHAWYWRNDNKVEIYENSVSVYGSGGTGASYDTSTVLSIKHDGQLVRYYRNGTVIRTVISKNKTLALDSSFNTPGGKLLDVKFGPMGETEEADAGTVFLDTFEHQSVQSHYSNQLDSGSLVVTYPADGVNGGRVLQAQNQTWKEWLENIPYDPTVLYRITAQVRRTVAPTNGQSIVYIGVAGVAADGVTMIDEIGTDTHGNQHYNCIRGSTISSGSFATFTGYFTGHATSGFGVGTVDAPTPLYTGVKYIRPLFILNYNGGDGTMQLDFIKIERVIDTQMIAPESATEVLTRDTFGGAGVVTGTSSDDEAIAITLEEESVVLVTAVANISITAGGGDTGEYLVFAGSNEGGVKPISDPDSGEPARVVTAAFVVAAGSHNAGARIRKVSGAGTMSWADVFTRVEIVKR